MPPTTTTATVRFGHYVFGWSASLNVLGQRHETIVQPSHQDRVEIVEPLVVRFSQLFDDTALARHTLEHRFRVVRRRSDLWRWGLECLVGCAGEMPVASLELC